MQRHKEEEVPTKTRKQKGAEELTTNRDFNVTKSNQDHN